MTLPTTIPSPVSSGASPASDDSVLRTPESPSSAPSNNTTNTSNNKRKTTRRANTAERRATHNAVERQRRETLNGRFLDLAALLPNLSQIRRPSKSAIVNSSIAHIHASRRHRLLAARELRLLKVETDALRREVNEWRDRAGIPHVEEPVRGEGFSMVLSGELEVLPMGDFMEGDEEGDYGFGDDMDGPMGVEDMYRDEVPTMRPQMVHRPSSQGSIPVPSMNVNVQSRQEHLDRMERMDHSGAMIASPTSMPFDSPAVPGMYEAHIPSVASMNTMGGMGMGYQGQMGMGMGMHSRPQGHYPHSHGFDKGFNINPDQAYLASLRSRSGSVNSASSVQSIGLAMRNRGRSGSMSTTSSGSVSPPHLSYGSVGSQDGNEWMNAGMMANGGMSGMGNGNVAAFGMM
ncbi:hypothetical protein D9758_012531 [Tetrapyrgos nigripes]|uniref:BHLH domain-containing protein n=1 Tax=Tetrapyrgos nigripes TaxID=182062 RepID=A0A8H5G336_9AGAR|nr:hypothetical protein D9758_012531 [Tetrapyrgos nigripes]